MSNEYKDWLEDQKHEARWWIEKYPFLQIKDNGVCPWNEQGSYDYTWLDDAIPVGWCIGFCEQMCDELKEALGDYADKWVIFQMKEKFGQLRLYHAGCPEEIYDKVEAVIRKYEDISEKTCCVCGAPGFIRDACGWIVPYCDECYKG